MVTLPGAAHAVVNNFCCATSEMATVPLSFWGWGRHLSVWRSTKRRNICSVTRNSSHGEPFLIQVPELPSIELRVQILVSILTDERRSFESFFLRPPYSSSAAASAFFVVSLPLDHCAMLTTVLRIHWCGSSKFSITQNGRILFDEGFPLFHGKQQADRGESDSSTFANVSSLV